MLKKPTTVAFGPHVEGYQIQDNKQLQHHHLHLPLPKLGATSRSARERRWFSDETILPKGILCIWDEVVLPEGWIIFGFCFVCNRLYFHSKPKTYGSTCAPLTPNTVTS